jgi:hypothetical protein
MVMPPSSLRSRVRHPPRHWTISAGLTLACLAVATAGCSSFQDESTIVDLRILGIMADPPEIYVDPTTLASQTDPITSSITALVVDPQGNGRAVSYGALACPREIDTVTAATGRNGVVCQPNVPGMTPNSLELTPGGLPMDTTDPGPEHAVPVPFSVPPSLLALAFTLDPYGALGFQLPIVIQLELSAGTESIVSTKRVIFSQKIPGHEDQPPNANPIVTQVTVYPARDSLANPIDPMVLPEGTPVTVPLGGQVWFEPGGADAQAYSTRALTRDDPPQIITKDVPAETLRYAFFTTAGAFSPLETSTVSSPIFTYQGRVHIESHYTAPKTMPADPNLTVWIVVRDERGGTSWTRRQITLVAP